MRREPADEVLQAVAEVLGRPDTSSADLARVHGALVKRDTQRWPPERSDEVLSLMVQLYDEGYVRGPRSGPLRGDNRIMDLDILGLTSAGRTRLAWATAPCWRRLWRGGRPVVIALWGIVAAIAGLVIAAFLRHWFGLP